MPTPDPRGDVRRVEKALRDSAQNTVALNQFVKWKDHEISIRSLGNVLNYPFGMDILRCLKNITSDHWLYCKGQFRRLTYFKREAHIVPVPQSILEYLGVWELFSQDFVAHDGEETVEHTTYDSEGNESTSSETHEKTKIIPLKDIQASGLYYRSKSNVLELLNPGQSELERQNQFILSRPEWQDAEIYHVHASTWIFEKYTVADEFVQRLATHHYSTIEELGGLVTEAEAIMSEETNLQVMRNMRFPGYI